MLKRSWALIALVYLVLAEVLSLMPVPDLSLCLTQPEHGRQAANHDDPKYCPAFHTGAALVFERTDHFLETHDKSVIGFFTIVLAISTIGLWLATNKLWAAGEKQFGLLSESAAAQSRDMQVSIKASEQSAEAAMLSARAAIGIQLPIIRTTIGTLGFALSKVGEREESASAWVDHLTFSNLGKSSAFPIELRLGATIGDQLPQAPVYTFAKAFAPNLIFASDPTTTPRMRVEEFEIPMSLADQGLLVTDQTHFWFYCSLVWDDFMETRHETGFCWRWTGNAGKGAFRIEPTAAYNRKT